MSDWDARDPAFVELSAAVCRDLAAIANAGDDLAVVPIYGTGTYAAEAAIGTLVPRTGRVLVLHNGIYGRRAIELCRRLGRDHIALGSSELAPIDPARVEALLAGDPALTHVALVHVEATAGLLNPLPEIAAACRRHGRGLLVDAMGSFGVLPIDASALGCDAIISASALCLEGAPGLAFVIARKDALVAGRDNSHSLALDLADQYDSIARTGQWRFTPPVAVVVALRAAIDRFVAAGGQPARLTTYCASAAAVVAGMAKLGFHPILPGELQAPIVVSFAAPVDPAWSFSRFYERVRAHGGTVHGGLLVGAETFRVSTIGASGPGLERTVAAIAKAFAEMGIAPRAPAAG